MQERLKSQRGESLIEIVMFMTILIVAIPPSMNLLSSVLIQGDHSERLSQAGVFAQMKMEQIIADKKSHGLNWVLEDDRYPSESPAQGFVTNVWINHDGTSYGGIDYALVLVTVSHSEIPDVVLTTWLTGDIHDDDGDDDDEDDEDDDDDGDEDEDDQDEDEDGDDHEDDD